MCTQADQRSRLSCTSTHIPAAQTQVIAPSGASAFAPHEMQYTDAGALANLPASQSRQAEDPRALLNFPAAQAVHVSACFCAFFWGGGCLNDIGSMAFTHMHTHTHAQALAFKLSFIHTCTHTNTAHTHTVTCNHLEAGHAKTRSATLKAVSICRTLRTLSRRHPGSVRARRTDGACLHRGRRLKFACMHQKHHVSERRALPLAKSSLFHQTVSRPLSPTANRPLPPSHSARTGIPCYTLAGRLQSLIALSLTTHWHFTPCYTRAVRLRSGRPCLWQPMAGKGAKAGYQRDKRRSGSRQRERSRPRPPRLRRR
jgi:hypothetical protein